MILSRLSVVAATACILVAVAAPLSAGQTPAENTTKLDRVTGVAPAAEQDGTPVPEPSNIIMLALGITGLVVGRYAAKRHRDGR